jgi:hypothetical protein
MTAAAFNNTFFNSVHFEKYTGQDGCSEQSLAAHSEHLFAQIRIPCNNSIKQSGSPLISETGFYPDFQVRRAHVFRKCALNCLTVLDVAVIECILRFFVELRVILLS